MKRKSLLFLLLAVLFVPMAMNAQGLMKKASHANFQAQAVLAKGSVTETSLTRDPGWLQYDDGELATNIGNSQAYYWTYGPMYPASMLGNNNTLSKVSFYETSYMMTDVTIEIYSGGDEEPGELLYTEDVALSGENGFHEVELAEAVTIDPTQNLWIALTVGGTYALPACASTEPNNNWVNSGGWGHIGDLAPSLAGYGWMIRAYVEYVDPSNSCTKPTQLAAIDVTTNSATLSWHCAEDITSWQLVYSTVEGFDPDNASPIGVEANPYTLNNLNDGTTYYAYIRNMCDKNTVSDWSSMVTFTTVSACEVPFDLEVTDVLQNSASINWEGWQDTYNVRYQTPVFYDDFENGLDNWTIYTEGEAPQESGWYLTNPTNIVAPHSGSNLASSWSWASDAYDADNWLITPQLDLQGTLSFWVFTNSGYPDNYEVLLSTTGNFIENFTITLQELAPAPANGEWNLVEINLNAYAGQQGYIAIHHADYDENYLFIDDFLIASDQWNTIPNVTSPYTLAGLSSETSYLVQIQGICPSGLTDWSNMVSFTTLSGCAAPYNLTTTDVTATSATFGWEGYQDSYNVRYRTSSYADILFYEDFASGELGDWTTMNLEEGYIVDSLFAFYYTTNPPQYLISPDLSDVLVDGSTLRFLCAAYNSAYPESFMVGYSSTGNAVEDFTWGEEYTVSSTSYLVYQEEIPEGTKYFAIQCTSNDAWYFIVANFMIYGPMYPAGEWVYVNNVESPVTVDGLTPETWYEWQVQGVGCGDEDWSDLADFYTPELTTVTETIALAAGSNWISANVEITLDDLKAALVEALPGTQITIYSQSNGNTTYNGSRWRGQLTTMDVTQMYMVSVTNDCEIVLEGMPINPAEHPATLHPGTNWIAFPLTQSMTLTNAFAGFAINGDMAISQSNGSSTYNGVKWRGTLSTFEPEKGYIYKSAATEDRTFVFPTSAKSAPKKMSPKSSQTPLERTFNLPGKK